MQKNRIIEESELVPYCTAEFPEGPFLVFAPHPDDETLGMGGTITIATQRGIDVYVVFITNGDMGGDADVRMRESREAATLLGIRETFYLNLGDRKVAFEYLPKSLLESILFSTRPTTLFLPSFQEIHPDHRATTHSLLSFFARWDQSDENGYDFAMWFYEINRQGEINRLIDISPVIEIKELAIDCYASQLEQLDYKSQSICLNSARSIPLGEKNTMPKGFGVVRAISLFHLYLCGIFIINRFLYTTR